MGGKGSGRKAEGKEEDVFLASPEKAELSKDALAVSQLAVVLTRTFADALGAVDTPEQEAAFAATVRTRRSWRSTKYRRAAVLAMVNAGVRQTDVASLLGISARGVGQILYRLRRSGMLADTEDRLDKSIVPAAIDALEADVLNPNSPGHQKAYSMALHGRGVLRAHTVGKNTAAPVVMQQLQVKFEMPADGSIPVLNGQVFGVPRE
jgi:predicted transcriptional regulator